MLVEFCKPDMEIIVANKYGEYRVFSLGELLPYSFGPQDLLER